jgi:hypothetical protein
MNQITRPAVRKCLSDPLLDRVELEQAQTEKGRPVAVLRAWRGPGSTDRGAA